MSGNKRTAPSKATVLDAMMDDLGNHRIEELAQDDDRRSRYRLAPSHFSSGTKSTKPQNSSAHRNGPAQMWNAAVEDGFNDDDAAGVSGLDPLDNGNAHRLLSGQLRSDKNRDLDTKPVSKRPKYNPSQPVYPKGIPKGRRLTTDRSPNGISRHSSTSDADPHVSSLGGIIPHGGEVKRWDSGRLFNASHHIDNPILNRPAGRGRPVAGQKRSLLGQSVQATGCGHGRGGHLPNPLQVNGSTRDNPTQQPQGGVSQGYIVPPVLQQLQMVETNSSSVTSKTATNIGLQGPGTMQPSVDRPTWVPPHLRKTDGRQSTASQSPVISRQASPRLSGKIPTENAREIFLQQDVLILPQCGTEKPVRGELVLYELLNAPIGIWELIMEDEKILNKGKISDLLDALSDGSKAFLRRLNSDRRVVSDPLRLSTVDEAINFTKEVNLIRKKFPGSETTPAEDTMERPVQNGVACEKTNHSTKKATRKEAVESTESIGKKARELSFELPQSRQPELNKPHLDEHKLPRRGTEINQHKVESRPQTPAIPSPTAEVELTPIEAAASSHIRKGSGGSDSNLISFSPDKDCKPSRSDEKLRGIPVNYTVLRRTCNFLNYAFKNEHPRYSNPAYIASFLHLLERNEFMAQSPDERKTSVETLYTIIGGMDFRTVLPSKVLYGLRSGDEACPEAIKKFNARAKGKWGRTDGDGEHPKESPPSRHSIHTSNVRIERENAKQQALSSPRIRDSSIQEPPQGVVTIAPQPGPREPTPSESSSKMSDKRSRGLMGSRWAQDGPEVAEQQSTFRGENNLTRNRSISPGLDGARNQAERIVDRKARSHRRSSTNDTMTNLADQLGSLSVSCERSSEFWG
ncbi:hypothetical protein F4859DRAFT_529926 [Xylaria cf. heliscus]|nr:hypothetical protein F4859DRAFT_529926 [Xylaria cf. heliscus]